MSLPRVARPVPIEGTVPQDVGPWPPVPHAPTAPAPEVSLASSVTLVLADTNAPITLSGSDQYVIGREDAEAGIFPDLDLTLSGGQEAGMSRRHALLSYRDGVYWIEDLNSVNYTFVNGVRLEPGRPHPLRDGDEIEFGKLRTRFYVG
jgi:pSer/pThr/pTyr-binding forkhead associated (FHA) protein